MTFQSLGIIFFFKFKNQWMKRASYLTLTDIFKKYVWELLFIMFYHKPTFYTRSYRLGMFGYISFTTLATASDPFISWSRAVLSQAPRWPRAAAEATWITHAWFYPWSSESFCSKSNTWCRGMLLVGMLLSIVFKNYLLLNSFPWKWLLFSLKLTREHKVTTILSSCQFHSLQITSLF